MAKDIFFCQYIYIIYALNILSLILSSNIFISFVLKKRHVNVFHQNLIIKSNPHCQANQPTKIFLQKKRLKSSNKPANNKSIFSLTYFWIQ